MGNGGWEMKDESMRKLGRNEEKVLLLLLTGLALPFTRSARQQYRLLRDAHREWRKISRYGLPRVVRMLENKKLVKLVRDRGEVYIVRPTPAGRERASLIQLLSLRPEFKEKWDGKWRVVIFDIPEKQRYLRNLLRQCLRNWDFRKLQASVFVSPNDCRDEIELLIRTCHGEPYIRFLEAKHLSRDWDLRKYFALRS